MKDQRPKIKSREWAVFPARLLVYLILISAYLTLEVRLVLGCGFQKVLIENTVVEWISVGLCLLTVLAFVLVSVADQGRRSISLVLALLAAAACVREMDFFLANQLSEGGYHIVLAIALLIALIFATLRRRSVWQEGKDLLVRPAFVLLLLGTVVVVSWAQILGQRELWGYFARVYPIDANGVKCMVEESLELIGYFLIFFGAVEELIIKPTTEESE
ncbi:MAG: hypothetical protein AB1696_14160 [Planctomycetota bacterium]